MFLFHFDPYYNSLVFTDEKTKKANSWEGTLLNFNLNIGFLIL